jgi:hypothetical protein
VPARRPPGSASRRLPQVSALLTRILGVFGSSNLVQKLGLDGAGDVDDMEEYIESFGETYLLGASHSSCSMGDFRPCYVFTVDIFLCRLL